MNDQTYVIGIDGGGTKTLGLLLRSDERQLARTTAPSTNIHAVPHDEVRQTLQDMLSSLCAEGGIKLTDLACICLGMAGCDSPGDRATLDGFLRPVLSADTKIVMVNDAIVAMRAVLKKMHGLLLIAGTGSICFGWNEQNGESARCGGWGHLLADEGSGYRIGMEALKAILRGVDGRGPQTGLYDAIMSHLGLSEPREILQIVYGERGTKANIANLARFVMEQDAGGDEAAGRILDVEAAALVELLGPVYNQLFTKTDGHIPLGLWGGNLVHVERYRARFLRLLEESGLPLDPIIDPEADAVLGAARHGLIEAGAGSLLQQ